MIEDVIQIDHNYPFDPTYGYSLKTLLQVTAPAEPAQYREFWMRRYERALQVSPEPKLSDSGHEQNGWRIFDLSYMSTDAVQIGGWFLLPAKGSVSRGIIIGHGYGGRDAPDLGWSIPHTALLFPCFRGFGRSPAPRVSSEPRWHVLHDVEDREKYILGGCVEDLWLAVSALVRLRPDLRERIAYVGSSFGGGIGAMALAWDKRVRSVHLHIPSFGHQPLRLQLPTTGSAASVQQFAREHPEALQTLAYYDAAVAARFIDIPAQCACARFDPMVAPPGQFAIYNSLSGPKELIVLRAAHHAWPEQERQEQHLFKEITRFFDSQ